MKPKLLTFESGIKVEMPDFLKEATNSVFFKIQDEQHKLLIEAIESKGLQFDDETISRLTILQSDIKRTLVYDYGKESQIVICFWDDKLNVKINDDFSFGNVNMVFILG